MTITNEERKERRERRLLRRLTGQHIAIPHPLPCDLIVAHGDTLDEAQKTAEQLGFPEVALFRVPPREEWPVEGKCNMSTILRQPEY